ncbi:hypothetical protein ACFW3D_32140 [Streptomyces sp. NPDC058864]
MEPGTATQLITVGATLGGVVLTLLANASLEQRRARDTRALEAMRLEGEQGRWLRDERLKAYSALSLAGEEALQFIRSELPRLIGPEAAAHRPETEARWQELRTQLRKAYNHVALFGADHAREAGLRIWRTARNGGNDILRDLDSGAAFASDHPVLNERIRALTSDLGTAGDRFLDICRNDLQGR